MTVVFHVNIVIRWHKGGHVLRKIVRQRSLCYIKVEQGGLFGNEAIQRLIDDGGNCSAIHFGDG